jgi:hypothetical protein
MRPLSLVVLVLALAGCSRPGPEECRLAVENIDRLYENKQPEPGETAASIRKCRAQSTKKTVACIVAATDVKSLEACDPNAAAAKAPAAAPAPAPEKK